MHVNEKQHQLTLNAKFFIGKRYISKPVIRVILQDFQNTAMNGSEPKVL